MLPDSMTAHEVIFLLLVNHNLSFRASGYQITINLGIVHFIGFFNQQLFDVFLEIDA